MQEELCRILAEEKRTKKPLCLLTSQSNKWHPDEEFIAWCPGSLFPSQEENFTFLKEQKGELWLPWTYSYELHVDKTRALWFLSSA